METFLCILSDSAFSRSESALDHYTIMLYSLFSLKINVIHKLIILHEQAPQNSYRKGTSPSRFKCFMCLLFTGFDYLTTFTKLLSSQ